MSELIERLRRASLVCDEWGTGLVTADGRLLHSQTPDTKPPYRDWSALMDEAADALEAEEDDEEDDEEYATLEDPREDREVFNQHGFNLGLVEVAASILHEEPYRELTDSEEAAEEATWD